VHLELAWIITGHQKLLRDDKTINETSLTLELHCGKRGNHGRPELSAVASLGQNNLFIRAEDHKSAAVIFALVGHRG
jgi:hypothetical protein